MIFQYTLTLRDYKILIHLKKPWKSNTSLFKDLFFTFIYFLYSLFKLCPRYPNLLLTFQAFNPKINSRSHYFKSITTAWMLLSCFNYISNIQKHWHNIALLGLIKTTEVVFIFYFITSKYNLFSFRNQ